MKVYNVVDEQKRLVKIIFEAQGNGQYVSHTNSYLGARETMKTYSGPFGLETICKDTVSQDLPDSYR